MSAIINGLKGRSHGVSLSSSVSTTMNPAVSMSFQQLSAKLREVYLNTKTEIQGRDAEITALKKACEQKDGEIAALKANAPVAELEAKVAELQERGARVKLFVDKLMAGRNADTDRIGELEAKVAELEAEVEHLVDTTADLGAHNEDLAADFDDMEQRASLAEEDNVELVASVKLLESIVTAAERDVEEWKAAHAHYASLLAEADEMISEKDAEIEELHGKVLAAVGSAAAPTDPESPEEPVSKKRRRGDGSLRREFTYDHVSVVDGKLVYKVADAEHPATDTKLRYVDVMSAAGRSYNRYYVVRDGKEKMCRSKADVERAFGLAPTRKYVKNVVV